MMVEKNIRHVPIVNDSDELIGLVTQRDLLAVAESRLKEAAPLEQREREKSILLSEVMTTRLMSVDESTGLRAAAIHLQKYKHGCLPVLREGRLIGIITDSDYVAIAINLLEQLEEIEPEEDGTSESE